MDLKIAKYPFLLRIYHKKSLQLLTMLLAFWTIFLWPSVVICRGIFEENPDHGPHYLTDGKRGTHYLPNVKSQDQCFFQPGQSQMNAFVIRLFKPRLYTCDGQMDALLICYESMLNGRARNSLSVRAQLQYQLAYNKTNKVARLCADRKSKWKIVGGPWNGIFIRSDQINGSEVTLFETALDDEVMVFQSLPQFDIVLMTETTNYTEMVTGYNDHRKNVVPIWNTGNKVDLQKAYLANVHTGANLNRYRGLWMLAYDMMPYFESTDTLKLYVYRACNCTMDAWFLSPNDKIEPKSPPGYWLGDRKCSETPRHFNASYTINVKAGQCIIIRGIMDATVGNDTAIVISLSSDQSQIRINVQPHIILTGNFTHWDEFNHYRKHLKFFEANQTFTILISMTKQNYHLRVNNKTFQVWGPNWWEGGYNASGASNLHLEGDFLLLHRPEVVHTSMLDYVDLRIPYMKQLDKIWNIGSSYIIHADIPDIENATFYIHFLHDAPEWHHYLGATIMRISFHLENNTIDFSSYHGEKWHKNSGKCINVNDTKCLDPNITSVSFCCPSPIQPGEKTEIRIKTNEDGYVLKIRNEEIATYKYPMPLWAVNWLRIDGDVKLVEQPLIALEVAHPSADLISLKLRSLLRAGDSLIFTGHVKPGARNFSIFLLHEAFEFNEKIGDVPLRVDFIYPERRIQCTEYANNAQAHKWKPLPIVIKVDKEGKIEEETLPGGTTINDYFMRDTAFKMAIRVYERNYTLEQIGTESTYMLSIPHMVDLPSWAVDHVHVEGDIIMDQANPFEHLHSAHADDKNLKQLTKLLQNGDQIKIRGIMTGDHVFVYLFAETIKPYKDSGEFIGKTVHQIELDLNSNNVTSSTTYYLHRNLTTTTAPLNGKYRKGNKLHVDIDIKEEHYAILIVIPCDEPVDNEYADPVNTILDLDRCQPAGVTNYTYVHQLPIWAVQYIVVENYDLTGKIEIIPGTVQEELDDE